MKQGVIVYFVMGLLVLMFLYSQFIDEEKPNAYSGEPITDSLIINTYPRLYEEINDRNAEGIAAFLDHSSTMVREQAWRALASTPIDSLGTYMRMALESESQLPWFTLSMHALSTEEIRALEVHWLEQPEKRAGISLVLGRQGDETTLDFLLDHLEEAADSEYELNFALAVGRLMVDYRVDNDDQTKIIERAFLSDDADLIRTYLYGYYRGNTQSLSGQNRNLLYSSWKEYGLGNSDEVDQYIVRLLGGDVFYEIALYQNSENELDLNIQLAVELSQSINELELTDRNTLAIRILLMHENPHVASEALKSLDGKLSKEGNLFRFISSEIVSDTLSQPYVWLQALKTIAPLDPGLIEKHDKRLQRIPDENPYLLTQALGIRELSDSPAEFTDRIASIVSGESSLKTLYAINALNSFWSRLESDQKNEELAATVRTIVFQALEKNDRGVAYACGGLLADERLFDGSHFAQINRALTSFRLPEDIEVYQTFGGFYKQRFEEQAKSVIDSLASLGYAPLNRSLRSSGWDVPVPEASDQEFRTPDWGRLWEIGKDPVWTLKTEKGIIRVRMNTLVAPATVSAIDSLTMAGAYDGIPFHRVVPNFVIQGGDIESQNGFGGPDFILPTEASEIGYKRGAVGIASAGTDTEGSQYFIMHQWKPHLNGGYTLFGTVIEGMDVVDRTIPGDTVQQVYWE